MSRHLWKALALAAALSAPHLVGAQEAAAYKETKLGLYATAVEAYEILQKDDRALLIDVRDPAEIMFTGWAQETDIHIPWVLTDRTSFDAEKGVWGIVKNKDFAADIAAVLKDRGVATDAPIFVMCRSGSTRSAPAADVIAALGYTQVYSMSDGFEGGTVKEGPSKGVRAVDGWRNSGLPWSYKATPDVAWVEGK